METYYYARVDSKNIVTYVTPMSSVLCHDENGNLDENLAINHLYESIPDSENDRWIRGCREKSIRKNYPAISYTYDESRDAFIPPKPFDSWVLNEDTCVWDSPVPFPERPYPPEVETYIWDEDIVSWKPFYGLKTN